MKARISTGKAQGKILAPPSKSMAHRVLIGAGLAEGISRIQNIDLSEDIKATLGILSALGCQYSVEEKTVVLQGAGKNIVNSDLVLQTKESGSTLRFFVPILLAIGGKYKIEGAKSLFARPLGIYEEICSEQAIYFQKKESFLKLEGKLQPKHYKIAGNISSQFVTGLLYALPLLEEDSVLEVMPPIESKAYIEMTLEALQMYGVRIQRDGFTFYISGKQMYQAKDVFVEGDYSNAAFLEAFNLVGGDVSVEGLRTDSLQGDQVYKRYFEELKNGSPMLDISECPDLGPILMGIAAAKNGGIFTGTRRLKMKESDRGNAMAEELLKFGIRTEVEENRIVVYKGKLQKPKELLKSHNDHRIAMTLAVLCTVTGGTIDNCEAVRKSFPGFFEMIQTIKIKVDIEP